MLSSISTGIAFEGVSEEEARQDNMTPAWQNPPPAYTKPGEYIRFSPIFREYDAVSGEGEGPLCRATIVMHELAHYVNENVVDYVREYDPQYDSLPAEFAVRNASCYPAFAQQVDTGTDQRYGSGRVSE